MLFSCHRNVAAQYCKNYYEKKTAALSVSGREAYGGQKQGSNISLTLETMKTEIYDFLKVICLIDQCEADENNAKNLMEFSVFKMIVKNRPADPNDLLQTS